MAKKQKGRKHKIASKQIRSSRVATSSTAASSKWIRIDRPFILPDYIKDSLRRLDDAGHIAYIVGGSVRDYLMGRPAKDHDIVTSALPDAVEKLFPNSIAVGKKFGVIKVPIPNSENHKSFEIATFRQDLAYSDHRHPTGVLFSGPEQDAARRDFTINALYYDPKMQRILDVFNGTEDIACKVLRAIGKPDLRFQEDALRLLRAVRFSTTLDFKIEPDTLTAIKRHAPLIKKISGERVREELELMIQGPQFSQAIECLSKENLLAQILPEVEDLKDIPHSVQFPKDGSVYQDTIRMIKTLAEQSPTRPCTVSWAALLHDVGKVSAFKRNQKKSFNGHEIEGAKLSKQIGSRLKFSRYETERISTMILEHIRFKDVFQMREATLLRWIAQPHFRELLSIHQADATVSDGNLVFYEFCASRLKEHLNQEIAITLLDGQDLIQLGFEPGPLFSKILVTVEDLVLEKKLKSKKEALEYVIEHFVK